MRRKFLVLTLLCGILLTGCNKEKNNDEFDIIGIATGEEVVFDADGDGNDDVVKFECIYNNDYDYEYIEKAILYVNDVTYSSNNACDPRDVCYAVKMNSNDNYYTFMIGDNGPSCDFITDYVYYDGEKLNYIGLTEGVYDNDFEMNDGIILNFDGTVTVPVRASIVQTWWYNCDYKIIKEGIEKIEKDFYDVDYDTELLKDMTFYLYPDEDSETTLVKSGTIMKFVAIDDEKWTKVSYIDIYGHDSIAYFPSYSCFLDENYEVTTAEYFKDLCFAD